MLSENIYPVKGIQLASVAANIRYKDRKDLILFALSEQANTAAVFTTNRFCAAPVTVCQQHLATDQPRYLLINSGNANAGTGQLGMQVANNSCQHVATQFNCKSSQVLPFSTGVIGMQMDDQKIAVALPDLARALSEDNWLSAAQAIMTTDTRPKCYSAQFEMDGHVVTITGIAKGAGMICPNMATMLSYIATDAAIEQPLLQQLLQQCTEQSFNRITVDGDTSTNDACVLMATGESSVVIDAGNYEAFYLQLCNAFQFLAHAIIRDAEGATKFITLDIQQAVDKADALAVAYTIAHSPLVKTAFFASDPNWGRILAAVGRAPVADLDLSKVSIYLGEYCLIASGEPDAEYTEEKGQSVMHQQDITVKVVLGRGKHAETVWTSDLSHDYVSINADYRS